MDDFWGPFLAIALGVFVFFGLFTYSVIAYDCYNFESATSLQTKMFGMTCAVKQGEIYIPMEFYKKSYQQNLNIQLKDN